jgi:hypothetical protein
MILSWFNCELSNDSYQVLIEMDSAETHTYLLELSGIEMQADELIDTGSGSENFKICALSAVAAQPFGSHL